MLAHVPDFRILVRLIGMYFTYMVFGERKIQQIGQVEYIIVPFVVECKYNPICIFIIRQMS